MNRFFIHSCYMRQKDFDVVCVNEKIATKNDDDTYKFENHLAFIENPKRSYYIHQSRYRNYKYKIEYVPKDQCDEYICYNKDLESDLKNKMNIFSNKFVSMTELCASPYVYGADVPIEVLVKIKYLNALKDVHILPPITFGALDLEASVLGGDEIIISSYCFDNIVYCNVLDRFLYKPTDKKNKDGNPITEKANIDDIYECIYKEIGDYLERFNLKVKVQVVNSELKLIKNTLNHIHDSKADFCGTWNMPYDIPKLLSRLEYHKVDPSDVFCHPDVPKKYRYARYHIDRSKVAHFTDSWDWFHCAGYTQHIDSMRLYARMRKVAGREPSYRLGAISQKEIGHGKLDLENTHYHNQKYNFLYYIAYNIVDAANVWLMEMKNHDVTSMHQLVSYSRLEDFSKQSVMLKNDFYKYCLDNGCISGTIGSSMGTDFDNMLNKLGGTVLPPYLAKDMGLTCIKERPNLHTLVNIFIKDEDASSMYPNTMIGFNLSKETNRATIVKLFKPQEQSDGTSEYKEMNPPSIEELFLSMIAPTENALLVGNKFFNLPTPEELINLYNDWFSSRQELSNYEIHESLNS